MNPIGPHDRSPIEFGGAGLTRAELAMLLVHGRGATTKSMLDFAAALAQPDIACIAPQAARQTWYDHSFLAPLDQNEPGISSGLGAISRCMDVLSEHEIPASNTILLGFSQGACLMAEYAARFAQPFAAVVCLSGGLIGNGQKQNAQPPYDKVFDYQGDLNATPIFIGCNEQDPHIPLERVKQTETIFKSLGGSLEMRIYPGFGHGINADEVSYLRSLIFSLLK